MLPLTKCTFQSRLLASQAGGSQPVLQMSSPTIVSLNEELLNTPRMTISDLIEATKVSGKVFLYA